MAERLGPPPKKADERFDNWVFRLWKRAFGALNSGDIGVTAPIVVATSGTGTLNIGHGTSGAIPGTYGNQSSVPIVAVNTWGHVTLATSSAIAINGTAVTGNDVTFNSPILGTLTNAVLRAGVISHATSGIVTGTYGGVSIIPQVVVNTWGHVTAVNTFGLTGTAVSGADITLTSPIEFASGTGTNAVLRAVSIRHSTSGIVPGTFGGSTIIPRIVVDTYGHVTAVTTFGVTLPNLVTNVQNGGYTLGTGDVNNLVYRAGTATGVTTWTVPSTLGTGALITLINDGTGNVTVTPVGTLVFAGTGATGNRTLPRFGMASVVSVGTSRWYISGAGVS